MNMVIVAFIKRLYMKFVKRATKCGIGIRSRYGV